MKSNKVADDVSGLRLLIAEDEMMLAMSLEDLLHMMGCRTVKAPSVSKALELLETERLDGTLLDLNLSEEWAYPVARELERRGIPYIFMSGYGDKMIPVDYRHRPLLQKPVQPDTLERTIAAEFMPHP